eukprot:9480186-Pyramimonas_sp.AAC.1
MSNRLTELQAQMEAGVRELMAPQAAAPPVGETAGPPGGEQVAPPGGEQAGPPGGAQAATPTNTPRRKRGKQPPPSPSASAEAAAYAEVAEKPATRRGVPDTPSSDEGAEKVLQSKKELVALLERQLESLNATMDT